MAKRYTRGYRSYVAHRPDPLPAPPWPIVLMLHGAGGTAAWSLEETRLDAMADRAGFLLVLPEGTRGDPSRPAGFLSNPQVWNDGSPRGEMGQAGADDVGFIAALLDELARNNPIDPARVYVTGFSNGAGMTFRLATELSHRIAAIAPVSGYCWQTEPRPAQPVPTLYLVGANDPMVPLGGGEVTTPWGRMERMPVAQTLARWARGQGWMEGPVLVGDEGGVRIERWGPTLQAWFIEGLGHHWPGGRGELLPRIAGPASDRVKANEVVWEFFCRHSQEGNV